MNLAVFTKITIFSVILAFLLMLGVTPVTGATVKAAPGNIQYERQDKSEIEAFPPSIFPHWRHRIQYRCDACHDALFEMKRGGTKVTMDLMKEGEVCGVCHNGKLAFPASFENCGRCHVAIEE